MESSRELRTREDWEELLQSIDTVLFDCDGVLWRGAGDPVPGAREAMDFLRNRVRPVVSDSTSLLSLSLYLAALQGKKMCFVSNNSSKSRAEYLQRFQKLGMTAYKDELFCTSYVVAHYLRHSLQLKGTVYLVGMPGFGHELELQGIPYTGPGEDPQVGSVAELLDTQLEPEVGAVVVGYDHHFNMVKLMKACSYLQQPTCQFIATNEDPFLPTTNHIRFPGTGCLVKAVSVGSERVPTVLGKPHPPMMKVIEESTNLDRAKTLMVGDRLSTDILFGKQNGLKTLLVLTGVTDQPGLETAPQGHTPDFSCQSIADILTCSSAE